MLSVGFPPVARGDARILVLGSLPGPDSLRAGEYYAHRFNRFWWIMGKIAGAGPELPYQVRRKRLVARGIALWDVCHAAERPGALDARIVRGSEVPNDFVGFFAEHPGISLICFNGAKAETVYRRMVLPRLAAELAALPAVRLPSTSPAHAGMPAAQKLATWRTALAPVVEGSGACSPKRSSEAEHLPAGGAPKPKMR